MTYRNFIGGMWINSASGKTFDSINPATEKSIGKFQKSTAEDVKMAIAAAKNAYPAWRDLPAPERAKYLFKIRDLLIKDKERLAKLETQEMGKVLAETRGDVQEAIDVIEYMAGEGRRFFGHTTPSELKDKFCMTIRRPIGVVSLIAPWNFPIAIPAWKVAPALLCGNCVVFKPSSDSPLSAIEFAKIIQKSGIPPGVFNLVTGGGEELGEELVKNPDVYGISFTGSKATGEWILQNAGVKKVGLELGGKNAIIIMEDANLELAVDGVLWGAFGTTGQRCTASSRVIIHESVKAQFEEILVKRTMGLKIGNGLVKGIDVGPLVNQKALEKVQGYVELGKQEGAKLLVGGNRIGNKGYFFEPTVFTDTGRNMRICREEIFGPVLSIISARDLNDAIEIANDIEYGLSSAIYTENFKNAFEAINKIDTGITYVNSSTIGAEVHLPFGGVKGTGNGAREAGIEGINEFSETKAVYIDYSGRLQKAQIDNN